MLEVIGVVALIIVGTILLAFLVMGVTIACSDQSDPTAGIAAIYCGTFVVLLGVGGILVFLGFSLAHFLLTLPQI